MEEGGNGLGLIWVVGDQALMSGLSLATNLACIYFSTKQEYAAYAMVSAGLLLGLSAQNALFVTPLIVNAARAGGEARASIEAYLHVRHLVSAGIAGLTGLLVVLGCSGRVTQGTVLLGAATCLGVIGGWTREYRRAQQVLNRRYVSLILADIAMVVVVAVCLGAWVLAGQKIGASLAVGIVGLAGLVTGISRVGRVGSRPQVRVPLLQQVRWTLPGASVAWLQTNSYPYVAGLVSGHGAVADLAAARVFVAPILLLGTAWNRYELPELGRRLQQSGRKALIAGALRLLPVVACGFALYAVCLFGFGALGGMQLLPESYRGVTALAWLWLVVGFLAATRSVPSIALQAEARFKSLFFAGGAVCIASVVLAYILALAYEAVGCLLGIAAGEAALAVLLVGALLRRKAVAP